MYVSEWLCCVVGVLFEATEVATEQEPLPSSHEVCTWNPGYSLVRLYNWYKYCTYMYSNNYNTHAQICDWVKSCMWAGTLVAWWSIYVSGFLYVQSIEKKVASILPPFRVGTHAHPTIGYHCASQDGVYEILFDNTYSRSVTLFLV